jgi:Tol biopolymer transport system component
MVQGDTTLNFDLESQIMAYSLCYQKSDTITFNAANNYLALSIHLNNITGTSPKTLMNTPRNSRGAQWSPNGKYIAFTHEDTEGRAHLYLYDTLNDSLITNLIPSDTTETGFARWTPDGRIVYGRNSYYVAGVTTCIINVDGSNNRILKYNPIYFYPDNYNTITWTTGSGKGPVVYRTNLDGSVLDSVIDLGAFVLTRSGAASIWDYNPNTNEILMLIDDPSTALPNMIAKYNITSKRLDTVVVADSGWKCYNPKYSSDFTKIAMTEVNVADAVNYTNRISILDLTSHSKTTAVEIPITDANGKTQLLDFNPFAFSPDDKCLAFSKDIYKSGSTISWISYLYVVLLETSQTTFIDFGIDARWNPNGWQ